MCVPHLVIRCGEYLTKIDEEGKKTLEDSSSFSPLEEKEVSEAWEAEAEKDSDNGVPASDTGGDSRAKRHREARSCAKPTGGPRAKEE